MPTEAHAADGSARERAREADASFLVRAPAGSGKTELLTQRFLRLLGKVDQPESLVALTFSRKAAAEMRARVLDALQPSPVGAVGANGPTRRRELAAAARARDRERGWHLAENPARLKIMTLDALALSLAARMPWLTRMGGVPRPTETARRFYFAAARAALAQVEAVGADGDAARVVLRYLGADFGAAETMVAELLARRDQWLPLITGADAAGLAQMIEVELQAVVMSELRALRRAAGVWAPPGSTTEAWRTAAATVLTKAGTPRASHRDRVTATEAMALHRSRQMPESALTRGHRALIGALCGLLPRAAAELDVAMAASGACDFTAVALAAASALGTDGAPTRLAYALDARVQHLFVDEFQDTSRAQVQLLLALIAEWSPGDGRTLFLVGDPMQSIYGFRNAEVGMFMRVEREHRLGTVDIEVLQLGRNFRSQANVVDWCNRAFRQISPLQDDAWEAAARLVEAEAAQAGSGGEVSVYAVPGGNAQAEAECIAGLVEAEIEEHGDATEIAILAQSRSPLVAVAEALQRRGLPCQGVKLRSLAESPAVSDALALTRALLHRADRVAWLAVLRAPWCGLTLADLLAYAGERGEAGEIAGGWQSPDRCQTLSADGRARLARVAPVLTAALEAAGRVAVRPLVEWAWCALGGNELTSPEEAIEIAAYWALLEAQDRSGALASGGASLTAAVEEHFAASVPAPGPQVQLMTMHQAKGLEFATVMVAGLNRRPRPERKALLRWIEWPGEEGGAASHFVLAPPPLQGESDALYTWVGAHLQRRTHQEQLRLLYVAATRAKQRLRLVGMMPLGKDWSQLGKPHTHTPWARLWPALAPEVKRQHAAWMTAPEGLQQTIAASATLPDATPMLLRRVKRGWAPQTPPPEIVWRRTALGEPPSQTEARTVAPWARPAGQLRRHVGVAVHAVLQGLAQTGDANAGEEWLRRALLRAGVAPSNMAVALAEAAHIVAQARADVRGRWILGPHAEARCEWKLTGVVDGRLRRAIVDRSFVDAGTRWVIDYKTAFHEGGATDAFLDGQVETYRPQLEMYARILTANYVGGNACPIRCGLYFPLLAAWREWAASAGVANTTHSGE